MRAPWSFMPLLLPAIMLVAGVVCGTCSWWVYFTSIAGLAAVAVFFTRLKLVAFALALGAIGALNAHFRIATQAPPEQIGVTQTYQADILKTRIGDTSQTLNLRVTHAGVDESHLAAIEPFDASVTVPSFDIEYEPMHTIRFTTAFSTPLPMHDLPDEVTPADIQLQQRVFAHCILPYDSIFHTAPTEGLISAIRRSRAEASRLLLQSDLQPRTKEFLCTALLGDATIINTDVRADFASAGLAHILALSGLHVGLIVMLVSLALWPLKICSGGTTVRTVVVIMLLWLYAVLTGLGASVVRTVLMLTVYLGARIFQRQSSGYNSLCVAAIIILLVDPGALYTIGFQLSFAAVASILIFANALNPINRRNRFAYSFMGLISVSLSAMIGTSLISCLYFHNLPVYFLLSNVATALLLPWLIGGGALFMLLEWCGWSSVWLCNSIDFLYTLTEHIAQGVASLPGSTLRHIYFPAWILLPYAIVVATLKLWIETRSIRWGMAAIGSTVITIACILCQPRPDDTATLYVARTTYHTDLVAYIPEHQPLFITTAPAADIATAIYKANRRYALFLGKRGYDTLMCVNDSYSHNKLKWNRPWLDTGNGIIAVISHDSLVTTPPKNLSHVLVCRGYRNNIKNLADIMKPDSVVLSYDLHPKRAKRYADECKMLNIPCRNMREDGQWQLPISSR